MSKLVEVGIERLDDITGFIHSLIDEMDEFEPSAKEQVRESVGASFNEGVHWFLFIDDTGIPFGNCYLQSVHNYWRVKKRFYLGGLYILPTHRGQKRFPVLYKQLEEWVKERNGCQIYCHIDPKNTRSTKAFAKESFVECYNRLHRHSF